MRLWLSPSVFVFLQLFCQHLNLMPAHLLWEHFYYKSKEMSGRNGNESNQKSDAISQSKGGGLRGCVLFYRFLYCVHH